MTIFLPKSFWKASQRSPKDSDTAFETRAIHTGLDGNAETGAVIPPIYATSTFASGNPGGYDYTRSGNPNFSNLEKTLASLEEANYATVFGSGVAAITAVVSTLKSGDLVLAEENLYGCTFRLFDKVFEKFGVRVEYYDFALPETYPLIIEKRPQMVWLESPTNPLLKVLDLEAISKYCEETTLVVDNTFASSYYQKPLLHGADLSLSSTTKYINGHSDCLGGVVCTNDPQWQEKMIFSQKALGLNPAPFDSWLISRGVKTLSLRMKAHEDNALRLTAFLEQDPGIKWVRYPYAPSHPQYALAKKQMSGGSGMVSADLGLSAEATKVFLRSLKLFTLAESLGGIESLVCHPASMTHQSVPKDVREALGITDALVRFSVGIESATDLLNDVSQALRLSRDASYKPRLAAG